MKLINNTQRNHCMKKPLLSCHQMISHGALHQRLTQTTVIGDIFVSSPIFHSTLRFDELYHLYRFPPDLFSFINHISSKLKYGFFRYQYLKILDNVQK